jgi:hypothetical protein
MSGISAFHAVRPEDMRAWYRSLCARRLSKGVEKLNTHQKVFSPLIQQAIKDEKREPDWESASVLKKFWLFVEKCQPGLVERFKAVERVNG